MKNQGIITLSSSIDPDYMVAVIYPEHPEYSSVKKLLEGSIAALVIDKSLILTDGQALDELSHDHFKAIQAHEISHAILNHGSGDSEEAEIEADLVAIDLLIRNGEKRSAKLLSKRLKDQRSVRYNEANFYKFISDGSLRLYKRYLEKKSL